MSSFHLCHCADIDVATRSAWQPLIRIALVHRLPKCLPRPRPSCPSIDFAKLAFPRLVLQERSDGMAARAEDFVEVGRYRGGLGGLASSRCLSSPESKRSQTTTCLLRVSPSLDRARRRSWMVGVQMVVVVEVGFSSTQMILWSCSVSKDFLDWWTIVRAHTKLARCNPCAREQGWCLSRVCIRLGFEEFLGLLLNTQKVEISYNIYAQKN